MPGELAELVVNLLEKDPARRYSSAKRLAQELHNIELNLVSHAERSTTVPQPPVAAYAMPAIEPLTMVDPFAGIDESVETKAKPTPRPKGRSTWKWPIALAAGLVVIGGGIWLAMSTLKLESPEGTLLVKVEGDDVEAKIKGKKVVITDKASKRTYELTLEGKANTMGLPPSAYEISVTDDSGLKLRVHEFEISKGGNTAVHVTIQPGVAARPSVDPKTNPSGKGDAVVLSAKATLPITGVEMLVDLDFQRRQIVGDGQSWS